MRISCPNCGDRGLSEFVYGGDASITRPALDAPTEDWQKAVYDRENPRGDHAEFWHHALGCRAWLRVGRDTATHRILSVKLIGRWAGEERR